MPSSKFLIGGKWRSTDRVKTILSPYDGRIVGEAFLATSKEVVEAVDIAAGSFAATSALASYQRSDILNFIAHEVEAKKEQFAATITAETGKPITFSRAEVDRSIFTFAVAAQEASRIGGEVLPLDLAPHSLHRTGVVRRFPIGPVAAITPFNFPLNLVAHKVAPAIAAGNPIVLKPSSNGILTALLLAEIIARSPLPAGVFGVVPCTSDDARQLVTDERIKLISFTGSPVVGWDIKSRAGKKRVVLELGGNAGVIVDRGTDITKVVPRIAQGSYGNAGQSCIAVQRIFVHEEVYNRFESAFLEVSLSTPVGDPSNPATVVGPMIGEAAAKGVEAWIKEAVAAGARVLCGGSRQGAVLQPTVLTNVKPEMKVCNQEVFAPVVTLVPFHDFKEAVQRVNDSSFGLQAGVFTNNLSDAFYAYEHLEVGAVVVNDYPTYRIDHMPYGGVKDSGFGREGIKYAIESMTEMKLLVLNLT